MSRYLNAGQDYAPVRCTQGLFEAKSSQQAALGARMALPDGRAFRYAYFVADTNRGLLVSQDISANCVAETDNSMVAASAGATQVDATIASVKAND